MVYNWHDAETSEIECVLSRGDRRIGAVIERVWRSGGCLEAWSDFFSYERWTEAMERCGLDTSFYTTRERSEDERMPWDHIFMGVRREFLLRERERAYQGILSPDCRHGCENCGARALNGGSCDV